MRSSSPISRSRPKKKSLFASEKLRSPGHGLSRFSDSSGRNSTPSRCMALASGAHFVIQVFHAAQKLSTGTSRGNRRKVNAPELIRNLHEMGTQIVDKHREEKLTVGSGEVGKP